MGKKVFLIIIWIISGVSFLIEDFYLNGYVKSEKLKSYTHKSQELLDSIDENLSGQVSNGQLNYLIWSQNPVTDELLSIKAANPLLKDILIFSEDHHLLAGSSDHYSNGEMVEMLKLAEKEKAASKFVRESGFVYVYPSFDEKKNEIKGFVVAVLAIPLFLKEGSAFVADVSRADLYCNQKDYLSSEEREFLHKELLKGALGESGKETLTTSPPKEIFWEYSRPMKIYFGYIQDKTPIYLHIYIYIVSFSFLITLIGLIGGKKPKADKYENYEKIIESNLKTLGEMKKGMELLLLEPPREKIIEIEKARELIEEETEESLKGFYHKPARDDEPGISDFIFLDPLDTRWYKPLKKRPKLPQKYADYGKDAFSEELLNLMKEVSGEEVEKKEEEGDFRLIQKDPLASSLERLYSNDGFAGEELDIALEYVRGYGKADGAALLFFNENAGCYMIEITSGLDPVWNRYFYTLAKDSIFPVAQKTSTNLVIREEDISNPFFRKRIPPEFLSRLGAIKLLPISSGNILIRVALFYYKDGALFSENSGNIEGAMSNLDNEKFYSYFQEVLPAFGKVYLEQRKKNINPEESYKDIYNILKSFTVTSDREVYVVHAISQEALNMQFREDLKSKCKNLLRGNERFIINNPNHLIFLLNQTSAEEVEKALLEMNGKFDLSTLRYPDLGKNLFAYL